MSLEAIVMQLRDISEELAHEQHAAAASIRRRVDQALTYFAPAPAVPQSPAELLGNEREPEEIGGSVGSVEQRSEAPTAGDLLRENARLQERLAELEQREREQREHGREQQK